MEDPDAYFHFTDPSLFTTDRRWPALTVPQLKEGLRVEITFEGTDVISVTSLHAEKAWDKFTLEQQSEREAAKEDPPTPMLKDVLEQIKTKQYGRIFDRPVALMTPYEKKYKELSPNATPPISPDETVFFKTAHSTRSVQTGKDVLAVAFHARQRAVLVGGGEWDVITFLYRKATYIGMTRQGHDCWSSILKSVRPPAAPPIFQPSLRFVSPSPIASNRTTVRCSQISPEYIKTLRCKPKPGDDYSGQIEELRKMGFTKCPYSGYPLENLSALNESLRRKWIEMRYYDYQAIETLTKKGFEDCKDAQGKAVKARKTFWAEVKAQAAAATAPAVENVPVELQTNANGAVEPASRATTGKGQLTGRCPDSVEEPTRPLPTQSMQVLSRSSSSVDGESWIATP